MNERIRELAQQAGYLPDMFGIGHWDMPECKKFAELIVRECMTIAQDYDGDKLSGAGTIIANRINACFGVEE